MKFLIVLLMCCILCAASTLHKTLRIKESLKCNFDQYMTYHGKPLDHWCFSLYVYEKDFSNPDDPLMFIQGCTRNQTVYIEEQLTDLLGDGDTGGIFQTYYEIETVLYHTCGGLHECQCRRSETYQSVQYNGVKYEPLVWLWTPKINLPMTDEKCKLPGAFTDNHITYTPDRTPRDPCLFKQENGHQLEYEKLTMWKVVDA